MLRGFEDFIQKLNERNTLIGSMLSNGKLVDAELYKKGRYTLETRILTAWKQWVDKSSIETVVISVGSFGSDKQQCPKFTAELGKVAILNIDPVFSSKSQAYMKGQIYVDFLPAALSKTNSPGAFSVLEEALNEWVHSDKNVILICHSYPFGYKNLSDMITPNLDQYEDKFSYIASYHEHQPVVIYPKTFFDESNPERDELISKFVQELWGSGKALTQETVDAIVKKYPLMDGGKFYTDLDQVKVTDLFNSEDVKLNMGYN